MVKTSTVIRPEIQALRAIAVLLVVLYHLWPQILTGGFVGVDVFFVISGFLITEHLIREIDRTGTIALARFWARRARRLLPAAILVLLVSAIAVLLWVPQIFWLQFFQESVASALYFQNWVLAADSVNYLAANNVATAAQHYWSLSVEEQFYAFWPLLILLGSVIAARVLSNRRGTIAIVLGSVLLVSLVYSIVATAVTPAAAYFITPTRAWEFAAGGLLAFAPVGFGAVRSWLQPVIAWAGWAIILFAGIVYSAATPFPGVAAAIPVLGAVAVIWAGAPVQWWSPRRLAAVAPVQWVGNISYSMYLWHWPLIVIAPYVLGYAQLNLPEKSVLLALSVGAAWLTKRWVEDPVRTGRFLVEKKPRWTFGFAVLAMAAIVVPAQIGSFAMQSRLNDDNQARRLLEKSPCFGAASLDQALSCANARFPILTPDPAVAPQDSPDIYFTTPPCLASGDAVTSCELGDAHSSFRVALIGDSHAAQWEPALLSIAKQHGWALTLFLKTNCAFTDARRSAEYSDCSKWSAGVSSALSKVKPFNLVITGFFAENLGLEVDSGAVTEAAAKDGFRAAWQPLIDRGTSIVAIKDTPHMLKSTTVCVAVKGASAECDVPASTALGRVDLEYESAKDLPGATGLDMTAFFCSDATCPAVVGGVPVHTDPYHMTKTYSKTLAPYLYEALKTGCSTIPNCSFGTG